LAAVHGPHLEVEFERDRISLELPESDLPNGWTITPLGPPVVWLFISNHLELYDVFSFMISDSEATGG